ncbi:MAG: hypothetical protein IJF75_03545 [Clostridia bacterium]|nr:hypothetical protein [Clostridia bacterium]
MLDERTVCLLKIINEKCAEGSYKVLAIDELVKEFPSYYKADSDLIKLMITALTSVNFISVKFDKDDEFCISPTPKGREYIESAKKQQEKIDEPKNRDYLGYFFIFLCVFLGTFLAFFLIKLIGGIC